MAPRSSRQHFNLIKLNSEAELSAKLRDITSKISKSNVSKCVFCENTTSSHNVRIQYAFCSSQNCSNRPKPCIKLLKCEEMSSRFSLWVSKNHEHQAKEAPASKANTSNSNSLDTITSQQSFILQLPALAPQSPRAESSLFNQTHASDFSSTESLNLMTLPTPDLNFADKYYSPQSGMSLGQPEQTNAFVDSYDTASLPLGSFEDWPMSAMIQQDTVTQSPNISVDINSEHLWTQNSEWKAHNCFKNGTDVELCTWKVKDKDVYFHKINVQYWARTSNGKQDALFQFKTTEGYQVVLLDVLENIYYKINWHEIRSGPSKDECTTLVFEGTWYIGQRF